MASLERYNSVQRWVTKLNKRSGSQNTRRIYLHYLNEFCKYAGLDPDGLISERRSDLESRDEFTKRKAEERLDRWFTSLEKKGLSRNTSVLVCNAVRSFYKHNYLRLEIDDPPQSWPRKAKPGLTREELGRLLDASKKPLHRAYILCQAHSGLSVSDLLRIRYGNVAEQIERGKNHIHLRMLRGKRKELGWFDTFFGEQATEALKEYLETRRNLNLDSRLFQCTARNINSFLKRISYRAGLNWRVSSHDLRKYFATQLKLARVNDPGFNETLIEYWQGHSLGKVKGAYFIPPIEEQLRLQAG